MPLTVRTLDAADGSEPLESRFDRELEQELRTHVDVSEWPLRATLWRLAPDEHVLCLNMHHLVSDAWSCGIVMQDLIKFLDAGPDGDPNLPPISWQYPDFAAWQHSQLTDGSLRVHQDYWIKQLTGMRLISLPKSATPGGARRMAVTVADIDGETFRRLRGVAREERTTIFAVMLAIYYVVLHRMTGQADLCLASLFANRARREVQSTVGFFANMVALRTVIDPREPFVDLLRRVRTTVVEAFLHECIPYQMLPLRFQDNGGRVDDVVFQMLLTPPPGSKVSARGVDFELYTPDALGSRFGLELGLIPQHTGACKAMLFYTDEQFSAEQARDYLAMYVELAGIAARRPAERLTAVPA